MSLSESVVSWKIVETVATRCHILQLECTKFDFAGETYRAPQGGQIVGLMPVLAACHLIYVFSVVHCISIHVVANKVLSPPTLQLDLKGPIFKGREGKKDRREGRGEGRVEKEGRGSRTEEGKGEEGRGEKEDFRAFPKFQTCHCTTDVYNCEMFAHCKIFSRYKLSSSAWKVSRGLLQFCLSA